VSEYLDDVLNDVLLWRRRVFPNQSANSAVWKMAEEFDEFMDSADFGGSKFDLDELADVLITLVGVVDLTCGWRKFVKTLDSKHQKNKDRTWVVDEQGMGQHVEEGE